MAPMVELPSGGGTISLELPASLREAPEMATGNVRLVAVAEPWRWPDAFRPRLLVETFPLTPDRARVQQLATRVIAEQIATGAHVATADIWAAPGDPGGRRIISLLALTDTTVVRLQYVTVRGDSAIVLTAEHDAGNHPAGEVVFRDAVASLRSDSEAGPPEPDLATMPRLDPFLEEGGLLAEDLSGVRTAQPYRSSGPGLKEQEIDAVRSGKLRKLDRARLVAAHQSDEDGNLTATGEAARRCLSEPQRTVSVEVVGDQDSRVARLELLQQGRATAVLAAPAPGAPEGDRTLDVIPALTSPIALARWIGLAPAWTIAIAEREMQLPLAPELLDQRLSSADAPPPPDASRGLRWMWQQPWQVATITTFTPAHRRLRVISTPRAGYFRLIRDRVRGEAALASLPGEHYLRELLWFGGFGQGY
ncbi:MAG: hypothetical protein FWD04_04075 [Conexibacteraceae bacterium]|nr:hypothetical protein [Conexibacteraceae bacterium]